MTRKECLDMAAQCVLQDRASEYGGVEDNFRIIANFWSIYLGRKVYPADVAMMMALLKVARIRGNKAHADSFVDLAGYAACGAECASGKPSPAPKGSFRVKTHVDEFFKAEGCEDLVVSTFDEARLRESMPGIVPQDAPATPEELCELIRDANPATYPPIHPDRFRPHTPTGEELAEAFEEEAHG